MPTIVDCPACQRKLRLPDEFAGKQVQCPTCRHTFQSDSAPPVAVAAPAPPPAAPMASDAAPSGELPPPPESESTDLRRCPYCKEIVSGTADRCPFCGEGLGRPVAAAPRGWSDNFRPGGYRRDWEPHRGTLVLVLGILSIALFFFPLAILLGIAAWIMGHSDLRKMRQNQMDPVGKGSTEAGWICGIIGTILGLIPLACCGFMLFGMAAASMSGP
jgi:hypothetical protein